MIAWRNGAEQTVLVTLAAVDPASRPCFYFILFLRKVSYYYFYYYYSGPPGPPWCRQGPIGHTAIITDAMKLMP